MSDQDEKRIIVKVAYNYFQNRKWDLALSEYEKLALIDPMDFLVHNMMAEIYLRKEDKSKAVSEYLKAASLLYATNNIEKAIHAYKQVLKQNHNHGEAKLKISELVELRLEAIDSLIQNGDLESALEQCRKLSFRVPEMETVDKKMEEIELLIRSRPGEGEGPQSKGFQPPQKNEPAETQNNDELVNNLVSMAERYEAKQSWDEAIETYLTILRFQPDDQHIKNKLNAVYREFTREAPEPPPPPAPPAIENGSGALPENRPGPVKKEIPKADFSETFNAMEELRRRAEARLRQAVRDRREREKMDLENKKAPGEALEAASNAAREDQEKDLQILMTQAQMYINQNMLVEALRICQRILEIDPVHKDVRKLLKKIYDKKNIN